VPPVLTGPWAGPTGQQRVWRQVANADSWTWKDRDYVTDSSVQAYDVRQSKASACRPDICMAQSETQAQNLDQRQFTLFHAVRKQLAEYSGPSVPCLVWRTRLSTWWSGADGNLGRVSAESQYPLHNWERHSIFQIQTILYLNPNPGTEMEDGR